MSTSEELIMDEAKRLGYRYSAFSDFEIALASAVEDLEKAPDYAYLQKESTPSKMRALDFLRLVAMASPERISDAAADIIVSQYLNANEASQIAVMVILALAGKSDKLPFIRSIHRMIDDPEDWNKVAAGEAIDILEGRLEIGSKIHRPGRFVYRTIALQPQNGL